MDEFKQSDLLNLQSEELGGRTPFCPDDREIASWYDDVLAGDRRAGLEQHLADCRYCRARIGVLGQLDSRADSEPVPGNVLAAAKLLGRKIPERRHARIGRWGAAAVLVLAAGLVFNFQPGTETATGIAPQAGPESGNRQLRSIDHDAMRLEVLIDGPTDAVRSGAAVRWSEVRGTIHYEVHVLTADGDLLRSERTGSPKWEFGEDLDLVAGESYFLRIEAVLPDGGTLNSRHIHFQAAGRQ
jgi:hypothetical protein